MAERMLERRSGQAGGGELAPCCHSHLQAVPCCHSHLQAVSHPAARRYEASDHMRRHAVEASSDGHAQQSSPTGGLHLYRPSMSGTSWVRGCTWARVRARAEGECMLG